MSKTQHFCIGYFITAMLLLACFLVPDWSNPDQRFLGIWIADTLSRFLIGFFALLLLAGAYFTERTGRNILYGLGIFKIANLCGIILVGDYFTHFVARGTILSQNWVGQTGGIHWLDIATSVFIAAILFLTAYTASRTVLAAGSAT